MDEFVCREYYCPACDMPSDEHREGSCRRCGSTLVTPRKNGDDSVWLECGLIVAAQGADL